MLSLKFLFHPTVSTRLLPHCPERDEVVGGSARLIRGHLASMSGLLFLEAAGTCGFDWRWLRLHSVSWGGGNKLLKHRRYNPGDNDKKKQDRVNFSPKSPGATN